MNPWHFWINRYRFPISDLFMSAEFSARWIQPYFRSASMACSMLAAASSSRRCFS